MNQIVGNGLTQEEIQDLADIVFHQLSEADRELTKYCNIVSNYILNLDYEYNGCTQKQAENCIKLLGGKVNHYSALLSKLKSLGAQ